MKKKHLFVLALAFALASCGTPSNTKTSDVGTPTSIEVIGAHQVEVGKTIVLACDVLGTTNDNVVYSSSDTSIATVDADGTVTGVKVGSCVITISSVLDSSIKVEYPIEVVGNKSKTVELVIDGENNYPYDVETGTYTVPMGKEFYVTYRLGEGTSTPNNVAFSLITPFNSDSSIARLTRVDETRAKIETYGKVSGLVVKVTISYAADGSDAMSNAATFDVVDENEISMMQVKEKLTAAMNYESESLTSVKYSKERSDTSDKSKTTTDIAFTSFKNATYSKITKKTFENDTQKSSSTSSIYSGVDTNKGRAFYFSYNLGGIKEVYINQAASLNDTKNASLISILNGGVPTFGIGNIITNSALYNGTIDTNIFGLSYIGLYANSEFTITDNEISIVSSYDDLDNNLEFNAEFNVKFNAGKITSYSFNETSKNDTNTATYKESFSDFVYGEKKYDNKDDNSSYLDISKYYMQDFSLEDASGTKGANDEYDFTNLDKYGPDSVEVIDGVTNYTLTYDKTLVLKVAPTNSSASTLIDVLDGKSSSTDDIPNPTHLGDNIYSVTANTDVRGNALTGEANITFTSINGIEKKIHVKYTKPELKGILVTNITNYDLGVIFQNESTNHFYLNTNPDEDIYSFELEMVSGKASGLTLYRNSYDNLDGLPGFSYSIRGNEVGKYSFRFKITGTEFTSDIYTVEVAEPYSRAKLVSEFVTNHKTFQYVPGGTVKFELSFESETNMKLTQYNLYDDSKVERDIAVSFSDGEIRINEEQVIFGDVADGAFFYSIYGGKLAYNKSLTEIYPYLDAYESAVNTGCGHYAKYTFVEKVDTSTLNDLVKGKDMIAETYISGYGKTTATMSFDAKENKAQVVLRDVGGNTLGTVKFVYTYNASNAAFTLDEITANNAVVMITEPLIQFMEDRNAYRLKIAVNGINYVFDFTL